MEQMSRFNGMVGRTASDQSTCKEDYAVQASMVRRGMLCYALVIINTDKMELEADLRWQLLIFNNICCTIPVRDR